MTPFPWRLVGIAFAILAVVALIADRNSLQNKLTAANGRIAAHCVLVRDLAGNPKMNCRDSEQQLAKAVGTMKQFRATSQKVIDAVDRLKSQGDRLTELADQASQAAAGRLRAGRRASAALEASAARPAAPGGPCEPSDELKRRWK